MIRGVLGVAKTVNLVFAAGEWGLAVNGFPRKIAQQQQKHQLFY
ncbi:MAG: hypothetical protein RR387_00875 [Clostridiales bacterium]